MRYIYHAAAHLFPALRPGCLETFHQVMGQFTDENRKSDNRKRRQIEHQSCASRSYPVWRIILFSANTALLFIYSGRTLYPRWLSHQRPPLMNSPRFLRCMTLSILHVFPAWFAAGHAAGLLLCLLSSFTCTSHATDTTPDPVEVVHMLQSSVSSAPAPPGSWLRMVCAWKPNVQDEHAVVQHFTFTASSILRS